ncbi:MAG: PTS sugar transporter subunit IIA [bacterium]
MNAGQLFLNHTKLSELIDPNMVIFNLQGKDKVSILKEMVDRVSEFQYFEENENVLERILDRESLSSTGVGSGFAFPHARIKTQDGPIICLGMTKEGIDFDAIDDKPVHVILLIIWKPQVPGLFNHLFGGLARFLLSNPGVKESLLETQTFEQVAQIFSQIELQISPDHANIQGANLLWKLQELVNQTKDKINPQEKAQIEKEIKFIREELDQALVARFDRLIEKFGAGVFKIKDGVCQGCMIKLSTSLAATVHNSNDIFVCPKCGRYIVD